MLIKVKDLHVNVSKGELNRGSHLEAKLIPPITQANRTPLSNQDSEFISTMAPTHPYRTVHNKNCTKTLERKAILKTSFQITMLNASFPVRPYPVSVEEAQTARAGANPLLFDVAEHVDEQRAVHLVSQVDRCVTLRAKHDDRPQGNVSFLIKCKAE